MIHVESLQRSMTDSAGTIFKHHLPTAQAGEFCGTATSVSTQG